MRPRYFLLALTTASQIIAFAPVSQAATIPSAAAAMAQSQSTEALTHVQYWHHHHRRPRIVCEWSHYYHRRICHRVHRHW